VGESTRHDLSRPVGRAPSPRGERRAVPAALPLLAPPLPLLTRVQIGGPAAERAKLEKALTDTEARASERWPERIEGARQSIRDAQQQVQVFTAEHLSELVADLEQEGEVAAANVTAAAEAVVTAHQERERIAGEMGALVSQVARPRPGDVSYSRADQVVRAASDLIQAGGEEPPRLRRDPRQPTHGAIPESASAA
jgi:hypothetical protein